jgi:hypothetical protein
MFFEQSTIAGFRFFGSERLLAFGGAQIAPLISRCFFSRDRACGGLVGLIQILLSLKLLCGGRSALGNDRDAQVIRTGSAPAVRTSAVELSSSDALDQQYDRTSTNEPGKHSSLPPMRVANLSAERSVAAVNFWQYRARLTPAE